MSDSPQEDPPDTERDATLELGRILSEHLSATQELAALRLLYANSLQRCANLENGYAQIVAACKAAVDKNAIIVERSDAKWKMYRSRAER